MRRIRGLIALGIAILLGLFAAKAVYWYLSQPKKSKPVQKKVVHLPKKPQILSERIPAGMRVVGIKVNDISGLSGKLRSGDIVDIIATASMPKEHGANVSRVILQGIKVFDVGWGKEKKEKKLARQDRASTVSLLVTPDQATILAAASESARIILIAKNVDDTKSAEADTVVFSYSAGVEKVQEKKEDLSHVTRPGMRAITIEAKDTDGILGHIRSGDRVDVIVTCPFTRFAAGGALTPGAEGKVTEYRMASRTLLQDVEVGATEKFLEMDVGLDKPVKRVTLLVRPSDAEKLAVVLDATNKSIIRLVSRNIDDRKKRWTKGEALSDILSEKKEYLHVDIHKGSKKDYKIFFR